MKSDCFDFFYHHGTRDNLALQSIQTFQALKILINVSCFCIIDTFIKYVCINFSYKYASINNNNNKKKKKKNLGL